MVSVLKQSLKHSSRTMVARTTLLSVALLAACNNTKVPNIAIVPTPESASLHRVPLASVGGFENQVENIGNVGQNAFVPLPTAKPNIAPVIQSTPSTQVAKLQANTSDKTKFSSKTFGVKGSPRVTNRVAVKKGGGRYQVGKPYTIRGIKYVPKLDPNLRQTGLASWYGPNFHGRLTANGEIYDQYGLSAAHPTMPLPSYAKVTNLENGSSITVRVNDRGPFSKKRVIDLSARAAQLLGYTKQGVAKVRVEYAGKAPLHGLDEQRLAATYNPGRVNQASIPPLPGQTAGLVRKQPTTVVAQKNTSPSTAIDVSPASSRINSAHSNIPRPEGLVNSYVGETHTNKASSAFELIDGVGKLDEPQSGMKNLVQLKFGPFNAVAKRDYAEKLFADAGILEKLDSESGNDDVLLLIAAKETIGQVLEAAKTANIPLYLDK